MAQTTASMDAARKDRYLQGRRMNALDVYAPKASAALAQMPRSAFDSFRTHEALGRNARRRVSGGPARKSPTRL